MAKASGDIARTVPIDFVRAAVALAAARGVDTEELLRSVGVAPDLIAQDRARVTVEQMSRTVRQLWRISDDEMIDVSGLNDPAHLMTSFLLASAHRLMAWGIGRRVPLRQVEFPFSRPGNTADLDLVFDAPLVFGCDSATNSQAITVPWTIIGPGVPSTAVCKAHFTRAPANRCSR
ncbi:AraC family transcriptional regulator ligand-binding domain-containing protein [Nocardia sp. NPDC058058]|uniref:AraC family transcriptional regulator ligand-binding domain-containing protein n=1 Tax=Nocardia sp. NPDC058058 TaxID=3346317 RepID=UPI0036D93CBA